ncbi:hypothetical protein EG329_011620 [Mollisiaceae sp. DMI_Dod_QoI]|nr:hypothetical protein EG329_011620 [Helotiales sp. DMI_Dod_QoI]
MDSFVTADSFQFYLDPSFSDVDFANLPDLSQALSDPFLLDSEPPAKRRTRLRAAKACLACRSRHMKCDSVEPKCTRCQLDDKTCVYTKSRRGGSHKVSPSNSSPQGQCPSTSISSNGRTPGLETDPGSLESLASIPTIDSFVYADGVEDAPSDERREDDMGAFFYKYFHPAHPIALPRAQFLSRCRSDPDSLKYLIPVIEYIGSVFNTSIDSDRYKMIADQAFNSASLPPTGFSVQALVLYALARHCSDEFDVANMYLERATDMALSIGMDRRDFAILRGDGDALLSESWRRTWWTLYMLDAIFASIGHHPTHRLQDIEFMVDLPCEDTEYESNKIPSRPRTFEEYDNREFLDEDVVFSSMTYLVDAIRIASSNMPNINSSFCPGSRTIAAADAKVVNWFLYLPKCKQEAVKEDGEIDETMFLAHMTINIEKMLLHRPHSALTFSSIEARSKCTPPADYRQPGDMQRSILLHTAKALEATSTAIMMFALPAPMIKHSPIVTCALALVVMAQVSACNHVLRPSDMARTDEKAKRRAEAYELGRDRVRLGLGALRSTKHVWALARRSVREVVSVSRELLTGETGESLTGSDSMKDSVSEASS